MKLSNLKIKNMKKTIKVSELEDIIVLCFLFEHIKLLDIIPLLFTSE